MSGSVGRCLMMCALRVIARASSVDLRLREEASVHPTAVHTTSPPLASFHLSFLEGFGNRAFAHTPAGADLTESSILATQQLVLSPI